MMMTRRFSYRPTCTYDQTAPVNGERSPFSVQGDLADRSDGALPGSGRGRACPPLQRLLSDLGEGASRCGFGSSGVPTAGIDSSTRSPNASSYSRAVADPLTADGSSAAEV